jgi:hypothetical protein
MEQSKMVDEGLESYFVGREIDKSGMTEKTKSSAIHASSETMERVVNIILKDSMTNSREKNPSKDIANFIIMLANDAYLMGVKDMSMDVRESVLAPDMKDESIALDFIEEEYQRTYIANVVPTWLKISSEVMIDAREYIGIDIVTPDQDETKLVY